MYLVSYVTAWGRRSSLKLFRHVLVPPVGILLVPELLRLLLKCLIL